MSNKILFLDESGDHSLLSIDPQHPIFVLGGIIVDEDYALGEMTDKLNAFKKELFGTTNITLHTADFTRQKNGFERMMERDFCMTFYRKLNLLLSELEIKILSCAIYKELHMEKYGVNALDPYILSLNLLTERFCFEIGNDGIRGHIVAEARDKTLNRQLELSWQNLTVSGTRHLQAIDINRRIYNLSLKTKQDNLAGLEIADAIITPIARNLLSKKSRIDIDIINSKTRKSSSGEIAGYGLIILPK